MNLNQRVKAPLSSVERRKLKADAKDIRVTAERKSITLDEWDERTERAAAAQHFELGCWLYYYSRRIGADKLEVRIDCARRIFEAGITNPEYQFFTIFDFGERQFDTLFEMGDAVAVIAGLRRFLAWDRSGNIRRAFDYMGWPASEPDLFSV